MTRFRFILLCLVAAASGTVLAQIYDKNDSTGALTDDTPRFVRVALEADDIPMDVSVIEQQEVPRVTSYADVLDNVTPAVVSVYTARMVRNFRRGDPMEELFRRFYGLPPRQNQPEAEERLVPGGAGSGVIVSEDGYILTNAHVVTDPRGGPAAQILVRLGDDEHEHAAELVGYDEQTDVAVLKIEAEGLPFARMADSDNLRVGDIVFAIGNPLGVGKTVTMGIVSGRLVGINTAILSGTGGNIGIGFAIPSRMARSILFDLQEDGTVQRGFLGVSIADMNADLADAFGIDSTRGALVQYVEPGLPADRAGIVRGDIITWVDDETIADAAELRLTISQRRPGEDASVTVLRDGSEQTFTVTLGNLSDPFGTASVTDERVLDGITLERLSSDLRQRFRLPGDLDGVLVAQVEPDSPHRDTLEPGMVLMEVNDRIVQSPADVTAALLEGVNKLWVYQEGGRGYLALRVE